MRRRPASRRAFLTELTGRIYREVMHDQIGLLAAGIAFYALLAIFPAMASVLAILGLFLDAAEITEPLTEVTAAMPASAARLIREQADGIVSQNQGALTLTAVLGLGAALYASARGIRHLIQGLNVAFNQVESRSIPARVRSIGFLSVFVVGGAMLGLGTIAVIPALVHLVPMASHAQEAIFATRWLALFSISTAGIAVIYRFGPDRRHRGWHWTFPGALVACLLWVVASAGFSLYAENFASYQRSFGTLAGVVVLLTWLWLSAYVLLLGAELNAALEAMTHGDIDSPYTARHPPYDERVPEDRA